MDKHYPYRFKTIEEFEKDYGRWWRNANSQSGIHFINSMDYLLGQPYPFIIDLDNFNDFRQDLFVISRNTNSDSYWIIRKFMLTKSKKLEPNYKPKEKIERTI